MMQEIIILILIIKRMIKIIIKNIYPKINQNLILKIEKEKEKKKKKKKINII